MKQYQNEYVTYLDITLVDETTQVQELFIGENVEDVENRLVSWMYEFTNYWNVQDEEHIQEVLGVNKEDLTDLYDEISNQLNSFCQEVSKLQEWEHVSCIILQETHPYLLAVTYRNGQTGFTNDL